MTRNSRRWATVAAAFLAAAPVLAGCGTGMDANTSRPYHATEAVTVRQNGIDVSQAFFLGPESGSQIAAGGAAPLYMSLVNSAQAPDQLVGVGVDPAVGTAKIPAPVELKPGQGVRIGTPTPTIVVDGLKQPLRGGESIKIQLQFANAGIIPVTVPVITRSREFATLAPASGGGQGATPSASPSVSPTEGATASPSPSPSTTE
ncbi:copper chaperone PCu(A)C [Streptosporangium sp. NPDC048047]|uniref:copper chaperone PCu(A)C n=1 Tax=Streptosporangium sp. NPDC048047 TaxID=3155748 RepID=UPI0034481B13